ncbi:MAG: glycine--tRNA ligase subunit beta [bacterium]|nr:glycine--tRNA ligase subunit beta [bacterium]
MNKAKDFLIEIGVEELPAGCLENATNQLKTGILDLFKSNSLSYKEEPKVYYTPRRLAVLILNIPDTQEDKKIEVFGPPKELSFNPDGTMTQAAIGFANSQGVPVESIKTKAKGKKEVICCEKTVTGKPTIEILKSALPDIIKNIKFKKSMKWEPTGIKFARPIRWFVALFGEDIIEFELAGVKSDRISQGLRGDIPITIDMPDKYEQLLEEKGIVPAPEKRTKYILEETQKIYNNKKLTELSTSYKELKKEMEMLMKEVVNLVEAPKIILCNFDKRYLELLPSEVIMTAMRVHQRYFALSDLNGSLSNFFILVANTNNTDKIKEGNENILKGRLEDAEFFYNEDLKIPLENRIEKLKTVVWQAGLGTLYDKTQRLIELSKYIAEKYIVPINSTIDLNLLKESSNLCIADLTTNMIKDGKEFTSLEGLYGAILAAKQGKDAKIVNALVCRVSPDTYDIKKCPEGLVLTVADKLDIISGAFILNKIPTGSSDPLGVRRAGNEFVNILIENSAGTYFPLKELILKTLDLYKEKQGLKFNVEPEKIFEFFIQRLKKYLEDKNIRYDIIDAIVDARNDNLVDLFARVTALDELKEKKEFITLVMMAKRIRNILKSPEFKLQNEIKETVLQEPEEKELFKAIEKKQLFDKYVENRDYVNALNWLLGLAPLINNFFDKILIMAEDINLRNNRLALINLVNSSFEKIADFSQIAE